MSMFMNQVTDFKDWDYSIYFKSMFCTQYTQKTGAVKKKKKKTWTDSQTQTEQYLPNIFYNAYNIKCKILIILQYSTYLSSQMKRQTLCPLLSCGTQFF